MQQQQYCPPHKKAHLGKASLDLMLYLVYRKYVAYCRRSLSMLVGSCNKSTPFALRQNKDVSVEPVFRFLMREPIRCKG